jgi:hypothetical protein
MTQSEKVKLVAKILKTRFPNLTVEETIDIAFKIVEALDE